MFDPYHKWLAIPKDQRPPTHYQLLGVSPTEQDVEVIDEAALRQMAHVRAYQIGEHAAESQRILNEISQARTTLLNPEKRKAYDATLPKPAALATATAVKAAPAMMNGPAPASAIATRPPPVPRRSEAPPDEDDERVPRRRRRSVRKASGGSSMAWLLAAGAGALAVVLLVVVGLVLVWHFASPEPPANPPVVQNAAAKGNRDRNPDPVVPPKVKDPQPPRDGLAKPPEKQPIPPPEKQPIEPPVPNPPAAGARTLDLIPVIDLNLDLIEGKNKWRLQDQKLFCDQGSFVPRVQIPYSPPEEYDFVVTFSQPKLRNGVSMMMPKPGGGMFIWYVGNNKGTFGFGVGAPIALRGGPIKKLVLTNTVYTTTVQVRRDGAKGFLNDQLLYATQNFNELTSDNWHRMKNERLLGVACDDPTTFYRIQIVEITGTGKAMR